MCSRAEAFGRVTVEAMKLGLPVIGAARGATPELVRDGWNGLLYAHGDANELAGKIDRSIATARGDSGSGAMDSAGQPTRSRSRTTRATCSRCSAKWCRLR